MIHLESIEQVKVLDLQAHGRLDKNVFAVVKFFDANIAVVGNFVLNAKNPNKSLRGETYGNVLVYHNKIAVHSTEIATISNSNNV